MPSGSQISVPAAATFSYDAAGNRTTMRDGLGTVNYSYDSLSRLTSESRTFTELSASYGLNYSYNLANALTSLSIPFRSRQIGYNYDTAGRLSGVTASGFSATHYAWPNQYTQNLTSFASNIKYRAWGARKSMTYGNTTSEQTTYNDRLQPSSYTLNNMNYQNTNVCCSYPTYSTMTWTYEYYDDGTLEHAWDSSNEWFDRSYKYDHAGPLKEASTFRRARGLSPYPAVNSADPYFQTITYDAFNHSSRTGKLYTGEPSDIGTYTNNRRTDSGWEYDADGNTISDLSYQQTIDASGAIIHSVSHVKVGDGIQYPLQPRLDITQTYDGDGAPAKRQQISRVPGVIVEFGNQSEPLEDTQTTHYVKSSLLGGVVVAEIGWGDTIYIYAGGERIAREYWGSVTFEHHNPVTGSWVTSHGHPSYRTTAREERDPRGAELPLSNPFAYAQSYVEWKFSSPLFIEGGDPFDYSSGLMIDGMPVSGSEFARRADSGSLGVEFSGALSGVQPVLPLGLRFFGYDRPTGWHSDKEDGVDLHWRGETFSSSGKNRPARHDPTADPQNPGPGVDIRPRNLLANIFRLLDDNRCFDFVSNMINVARQLTGKKPYTYDAKELAIAIARQENGGFIFTSGAQGGGGGGSAYGDIFSGEATVEITMFNTAYGPRHPVGVHVSYALAALHEIVHLAGGGASRYDGGRSYYFDVVLARAAQILTDAPGYPAGYDPDMPWWQITGEMTKAASTYWDTQLLEHCTPQEYR